jgi:hypothetical protein
MERVFFLYVDKAVNMYAEGYYTETEAEIGVFNFSLKAGWNAVLLVRVRHTETGRKTTFSQTVPSGLKWIFCDC